MISNRMLLKPWGPYLRCSRPYSDRAGSAELQAEVPAEVQVEVRAADRQVPVEVLVEEQAGPEKLQALRNYRRMTGRL